MEQKWIKASACAREGGCVQAWRHEDVVMIRESERPFETISTPREQWDKFIAGVKAGEFDLL